VHHVLAGYFSLPQPSELETQSGNQAEHENAAPAHRKSDCQKNQNKTEPNDSRLSHLRHLVHNQDWLRADKETWELLAGSLGGNHQHLIPSEAWSAIPCSLLYELNQAWALNSSHRFGFSIQRSLWEEISRIHERLEKEIQQDSGITLKPRLQVFREFLNTKAANPSIGATSNEESALHPYDLPPGYFPRGGKDWTWGNKSGWSVEHQRDHLIDEFSQLYERLADCGITSTVLDSEFKQKLAALSIAYDPSKDKQNRNRGTNGSKTTQSQQTEPSQDKSHINSQFSEPPAKAPQARTTFPTDSSQAAEGKNTFSSDSLLALIATAYMIIGLGFWGLTGDVSRKKCSFWWLIARPLCLVVFSTQASNQ